MLRFSCVIKEVPERNVFAVLEAFLGCISRIPNGKAICGIAAFRNIPDWESGFEKDGVFYDFPTSVPYNALQKQLKLLTHGRITTCQNESYQRNRSLESHLAEFQRIRDRQMTELVNSLQTPSVGFRFRAFRLCAAFRKG